MATTIKNAFTRLPQTLRFVCHLELIMLISCHQVMHFIIECCHLLLECFNLLELTLIQEVAPPFSINPHLLISFFHHSCLCVFNLGIIMF